jgi:hypothetical protein
VHIKCKFYACVYIIEVLKIDDMRRNMYATVFGVRLSTVRVLNTESQELTVLQGLHDRDMNE